MKYQFTLILCLFILFNVSSLSSQDKQIKERIKESVHSEYPDANAAYLINDCKVSYYFPQGEGPTLHLSYHLRIKIYSDDANSLGDFELNERVSGRDTENIYDISGVVYNFENGTITKTELSKDNIYESKKSMYSNKVNFALPNVQKGSIIDLTYKKRSPFIYTIPRHYFQYDIPVESSTLNIGLPNKMAFNPIAKGAKSWTVAKEVDNFQKPPRMMFNLKAENVAPIKEDNYVLDINDYRSSIKYELSTYYYDDGRVSHFSKSWEEIAKDLHHHKDFGKQLKNGLKPIKSVLAHIDELDDHAKMKLIYDYVQENYSWNDYFGVYAQKGVKKLMSEKSGNVADINLLLVNLLRKADIDANPMVIKSRSSGVLDSIYPSITEPNYLLAYVKNGDKEIILDATSKLTPFGELPLRAINDIGVVIIKDKAKIVQTKNPNTYKTQELSNLEIDIASGWLIGTRKGKLSNYAARLARDKNKTEIKDSEIQFFSDSNMDQYDIIENLDDIDKGIIFERSEKISSVLDQLDDKIFINAFIIDQFDKNPFTVYKRQFPVFFNSAIDI